MLKNSRLLGILMWLFSFQTFAYTNKGQLAQYLWLDIGTALVMFMVASYLLGLGLDINSESGFVSVLVLILLASLVMAIRFSNLIMYHWYDAWVLFAGPQVFVMAIGFWLSTRQKLQLQPNC